MLDRFIKKVSKTDSCWIWTGSKNKKYPHGRFRIGARVILAHRFSYEHFVGPIPERFCVCHKCDNPSCVNPDHLFLGSKKDNAQDMIKKGRDKRFPGSLNGFSKLNEDKVREIRYLYANGLTQAEIGRSFGVSQRTVSLIVRREYWKHV